MSPTGDRYDRPLTVVSNRLPYNLPGNGDGRKPVRNVGGLVNALEPALEARQGNWIGWDGVQLGNLDEVGRAIENPRTLLTDRGVQLTGVPLSDREIQLYYHGFANRTLWPLFHGLLDKTRFLSEYYSAYVRVNRRFAEFTLANAGDRDQVWVHDYHLMLLPKLLRDAGFGGRIDFFLHIPFPPAEIFRTLPWRESILEGLLATDSVVFHVPGYRDNFCRLAADLEGARIDRPEQGEIVRLRHEAGTTLAAALPIGVDVEDFERLAASPEVRSRVEQIRKAHGGRHILFGADRLDYTKGIRERLLALDRFLSRNPAAKEKVSMLQVVVPSRHKVREYRDMKQEIDREVGRINGQHGRGGWVPIHYQFNAMDRTELAAHYLASRAALVTPLKDGMNLVAPEFVATRTDERGVLVLSEFAGVSRMMDGSLRINPYDIDSLANAIGRALTMPSMEQAMRMRSMRRRVRSNTISAWTDRCLDLELPVRRPARLPRASGAVRPIPRDLSARG